MGWGRTLSLGDIGNRLCLPGPFREGSMQRGESVGFPGAATTIKSLLDLAAGIVVLRPQLRHGFSGQGLS